MSPPPIGAIPRLDTVRGLVLPTDAFRPTAEQERLVAEAQERLIARCMSRYGFTWQARPHAPSAGQVDRLYGVADPDTASTYGYHLPSADPRAAGGEPGPGGRTAAEVSVLRGLTARGDAPATPPPYQGKAVPRGGCDGQARREVTGVDELDPIRLVDAVTVAMWEQSKADSRVVAAVADWSACMKRAGYDYPSPLRVGDGHADWSQGAPISQEEKHTAVADVRCKQSTNLIGIWFTVESAYEREAIRAHLAELTSIRNGWAYAARNAAVILGVPTPTATAS